MLTVSKEEAVMLILWYIEGQTYHLSMQCGT